MNAIRILRAGLPVAVLSLAACGQGLQASSSAVVDDSGRTRTELTVPADAWSTLLSQAPGSGTRPPGGPGGGGMGPPLGGPGGQPPEEAFTACAQVASGGACTVTHDGQTIAGTCRTGPGPEGSRLACVPNDAPPMGPGGGCDGGGQGGPQVPGVAGSLDGSEVQVRLAPPPPPGTPAASARAVMVDQRTGAPGTRPSGFILVPEIAGGHAPTPPAGANVQTESVHLYVDHGNGFEDFGAYTRIDFAP